MKLSSIPINLRRFTQQILRPIFILLEILIFQEKRKFSVSIYLGWNKHLLPSFFFFLSHWVLSTKASLKSLVKDSVFGFLGFKALMRWWIMNEMFLSEGINHLNIFKISFALKCLNKNLFCMCLIRNFLFFNESFKSNQHNGNWISMHELKFHLKSQQLNYTKLSNSPSEHAINIKINKTRA